mgnify:CR=1 FL=1
MTTPPPPPPGNGPDQPFDSSGSAPPPPGQGQGQPSYGSDSGQPPQAPPPAPGGAPQGGSDKAKTMSIISIVSGAIGLVCCTWFIFSIVAIVLAVLAKKEPGSADSQKKAQIGLILGAIGLVLGVVTWIGLVATGSLDVYTS